MPFYRRISCFCLFLVMIFHADAQELWTPFPLKNSSLAPWIQVTQTQDLTGYELFEAYLRPVESEKSLSLTLYFRESSIGFLRVIWTPLHGSPTVLSSNLYEGTGLRNQRTLLISPSQINPEGGHLLIQSDQSQLGIDAIHWSWVESQSYLTSLSSSHSPHLILPHIQLRKNEVSGESPLESVDQINQSIVRTALTPHAEIIDVSMSYGLDLESIPGRARLEVLVQGLPIQIPLTLYLNQERLGELAIETPPLGDPAYLSKQSDYWGWRKATLWIPVTKLKTGLNTLQILSPISEPIALKNMIFEADFQSMTPP